MRTALALLVILVVVPATSAGEDEVEAAYYRAFYLENAMRDFPAAIEAYGRAIDLATPAGRKDMQIAGHIGRGRCRKALGELEAAAGDARSALAIDKENVEAKALLATVERSGAGDDEVAARLRGLVAGLRRRQSTSMQTLLLAGVAAVPYLEEALHQRDQVGVQGAAQVLAKMGKPEALAALARAFEKPSSQSFQGVRRALSFLPTTPEAVKVITAGLTRKDPEERSQIASFLVSRISAYTKDPKMVEPLRAALTRVAADPSPGVRRTLVAGQWLGELADIPVPVIREALAVDLPDIRIQALNKLRTAALVTRLADDLARIAAKDDSPRARQTALHALMFRENSRVYAVKVDIRLGALENAIEDPDPAVFIDGVMHLIQTPISPAWEKLALKAYARALTSPGRNKVWDQLHKAISRATPGFIAGHVDEILALYDVARRPASGLGKNRAWNTLRALFSLLQSKLDEESCDDWMERICRALPTPRAQAYWLRWSLADGGKDGGGIQAPRAAAAMARSPDPAVRLEAYRCLHLTLPRDEKLPDLPHLAKDARDDGDYLTEDPTLYHRAHLVTPMWNVVLRLIRDHPPSGHEKLLWDVWRESEGSRRSMARQALVVTVGKDALAAVRADLATEGLEVLARKDLIKLLGTDAVPDLVRIAVESKSSLTPLTGFYNTHGSQRWFQKDALPKEVIERYVAEIPEELVCLELIQLTVARVPNPLRRRLLLAGLASSDKGTKLEAAKQAGVYNVADAWSLLVDLLDDPDVQLRKTAKESLEEIRSYSELRTAFERFGREDRRKSFERAKALLDDESPEKRCGGAYALGALGDPAAIPLLLDLLDDGDESVRKAGLAALERLGGGK
jgi:HEAT repeat protein